MAVGFFASTEVELQFSPIGPDLATAWIDASGVWAHSFSVRARRMLNPACVRIDKSPILSQHGISVIEIPPPVLGEDGRSPLLIYLPGDGDYSASFKGQHSWLRLCLFNRNIADTHELSAVYRGTSLAIWAVLDAVNCVAFHSPPTAEAAKAISEKLAMNGIDIEWDERTNQFIPVLKGEEIHDEVGR